jgi:dipeptidase E
MRLYLSSYQMGDRFDDLVAFMGPGAKVAVVSNALDGIPADLRQQYRGFSARAHFNDHGLDASDLDLRDFFDAPQNLLEELSGVRLIWAVGGNAFLLRRAMRQSGLDDLIVKRVGDGSLTYGGWSAGTCVAGVSLRGIDIMDDPPLVPTGYDPTIIWDGLGLVDFIIVPHFASDHPEAALAAAAVDWLKQAGLPFRAIRDGEVIVS